VPELEAEGMPVTVAVDSNGESVLETGPKEWRVKIASLTQEGR
jgi:fumarate hydratase class I